MIESILNVRYVALPLLLSMASGFPPPTPPLTHVSGFPQDSPGFTFAVAADMRQFAGPGVYDTVQYFRGASTALLTAGGADFLIVPGDLDPVSGVQWTISQTFGGSYRWIPVVGNHELPGQGSETTPGENIAFLRSFDYGTVQPGPAGCPTTTFSFDHDTAHFAILNEYCDSDGDTVIDGDIPDHLYDWLAADLASTTQPFVFVIGHEPAYPQPDAANGRLRHETDSLNAHAANRDRFWNLLQTEGVIAYICGHTHNTSIVNLAGVWQVDAGHARGIGDTGAASTFLRIQIVDQIVTVETYRDDSAGGPYSLWSVAILESPFRQLLPLIYQ